MNEPIDQKARSAYDEWHSGLEVNADADEPWHKLVRRHLHFPRDIAGRAVLEIGCGRGGFACWLATRPEPPRELIGADFSAAAIEKAREFATERGITLPIWEVGDIGHLAHPDGRFDTVISCETIEHVPDPRHAVRELARVLKPGGRLFLTTPNYLGPLGLYRGYMRLRGRRYTEGGQPINHFTVVPRTRSWVRASGLRVLRCDGAGHYLPFPGRPPIPMPALERLPLTRWFALHSFVMAAKERG